MKDRRVLKLIRGYLESGVCEGGLVMARKEGTPQGGPLSPLLSNILFVDVQPQKEDSLRWVMREHPKLREAGEGSSTPEWVIGAQRKWSRFMELAP